MAEAEFPEDIEEMQEEALAESPAQPAKPNAFSVLMSSPQKAVSRKYPRSFTHRMRSAIYNPRDGLGEYLTMPKHPRIIYQNDFGVAIWDMYPKAFLHALFIPRDETKYFQHPIDAFEDPVFLAQTKQHVAELQRVVGAELRNQLGSFSATEQPRRRAMDKGKKTVPVGRDWASELLVGIHAGPSMNHLHVHVQSPDHVNECLRTGRHYNSFATPFLVRLDEFPLAEDDERRDPNHGGYLGGKLYCWRCKERFGTRISALKVHLEEEFDEWKRL